MLNKIDLWLMSHQPNPQLKGIKRFWVEFWFFGLKEARACLFAGVFFIAMYLIPKKGIAGIHLVSHRGFCFGIVQNLVFHSILGVS